MRRVLLHVRVVVVMMRVLRMLLLWLVRLLRPAPGVLLEPDELHRGRRARGVGYALDVIHEHCEHLVVDNDLLRNRLHCKARAHVVSVGFTKRGHSTCASGVLGDGAHLCRASGSG